MPNNLMKCGGWSVVVSPITNELYIYRADLPGQILIRKSSTGYEAELFNDNSDELIASCSATFDDLFVPQ